MPGRRETLVLGAVGLAAAAAGALVGPLALQSESGAADLLSARYPDITGKPHRILEWQGRVLVCNFWATWCEPCRLEVPLLLESRRKFLSRGAEVVGIGIDHAAKIIEFVKEFSIDYPVLIADPSAIELMRKLGNRAGGLPFTVILGRAGSIGYRRLGLLKQPDLDEAVVEMLG